MHNVIIFFTIHVGHPPGFSIILEHVLLVSEIKGARQHEKTGCKKSTDYVVSCFIFITSASCCVI
jgi:hypothetical protein